MKTVPLISSTHQIGPAAAALVRGRPAPGPPPRPAPSTISRHRAQARRRASRRRQRGESHVIRRAGGDAVPDRGHGVIGRRDKRVSVDGTACRPGYLPAGDPSSKRKRPLCRDPLVLQRLRCIFTAGPNPGHARPPVRWFFDVLVRHTYGFRASPCHRRADRRAHGARHRRGGTGVRRPARRRRRRRRGRPRHGGARGGGFRASRQAAPADRAGRGGGGEHPQRAAGAGAGRQRGAQLPRLRGLRALRHAGGRLPAGDGDLEPVVEPAAGQRVGAGPQAPRRRVRATPWAA